MYVEIAPLMPSRPCRFCLCLQRGSVFADFDVDAGGNVFLCRISFDGYGCDNLPVRLGAMSQAESSALLAMIELGSLDAEVVERLLRAYFSQHQQLLWADAMRDHDLI